MFDESPKSLFGSLEAPMTIYAKPDKLVGSNPWVLAVLYFKEKTPTHGFFETRNSYPCVLTTEEVNEYYRKEKP